MHQRVFTLLLLAGLISMSSQHFMGKNAEGFDLFKIDLDLDPKQRFLGPAQHYEDTIKSLISMYMQYVPSVVLDAFWAMDWIIKYYHPERYGEIQGMAEFAKIDTHLAVMMNYVYEFDSYCTSVIAKLNNGTIVHMRNLDFYFSNDTRNITYIGQYYKNGQHLYDAVMFAGIISPFTGYKDGKFAISLNQRDPSQNYLRLIQNVGMIFTGYKQSGWTIREALESCEDYACAVLKVSTDHHIAPSYMIVSGLKNNEGTIITRDRFSVANVRQISDQNWYLYQTNQDHYNGDCPIRCQHAKAAFEKVGRNATIDAIYQNVLQEWPNLNYMSIHSAQMSAALGLFQVEKIYAYDQTDPGDL
ncbi:UNKNOWN [Stylonychia lemnae]|uniref:Uncharacterized protein n=1 Tax=Stylonychia lemnae TaxID=5949 RepID=A0A078A1W0_STYLE|nr:UNKNOWN [Stylonychia lemnae]|eukprot:CDW76110.1 UNKNOWN [Stylonychia lemnae]